MVVMLVTSFKEGYEDMQRHHADSVENVRKVTVITFEDGEEVEHSIETQHIKAGDIIKLTGTQLVPADMVIIMTSMYADANQCFIETANLDGETNLKSRMAAPALKSLCTEGRAYPSLFDGSVEYEPPNRNLHSFIGAIHIKDQPSISLSAENVMLRGCLFSNTDWCYGVALYTGQQTKIQMNNRHASNKMSQIEKYANTAILMIFILQSFLVAASVASIYIYGYDDLHKAPYAYAEELFNYENLNNGSVLPLWLEYVFIYYLLYNNCIPISLYVTLEIVNIGQAYLISNDKEMYDEKLDTACIVRSSSLVQELGIVGSVFSDKTGTLTRNEMVLVQFVIDGRKWSIPGSADGEGILRIPEGRRLLEEKLMKRDNYSKYLAFFRALILCHTVMRGKNGQYRAESPDELALVQGIEGFNCHLLERSSTSMTICICGETTDFEILLVNAFTSDRKRMSILVKEVKTGKYLLLCKGADNVMMDKLRLDEATKHREEKSLFDLAALGLRTLVIAEKILTYSEAMTFIKKFDEASNAISHRADQLYLVAEEMEWNMDLLGVTAIEDKLQDEVPEVIADLIKASITVWMLTGDKEETAVNIGNSCNLIREETTIHTISKVESAGAFTQKLQEVYDIITTLPCSQLQKRRSKRRASDSPILPPRDPGTKDPNELCLVLDGPSFKFYDEQNEEHRTMLLTIGQACRSVIACRLIPVQKQALVALVKYNSSPKVLTLAIGDGANDVSMIREGDVGVGIIGKEGRQAANNSDFAIGQFKFLRRLLLVHGRANYMRQAKVFLYSVHKNIAITLTLFWYSYWAYLSGVSPYESWVYTSFNIALALPIIFFGMMDRDLSPDFVLRNPQVFITSRLNNDLNTYTILCWLVNSICYAVVFGLVMYFVLDDSLRKMEAGLYEYGTFVFASLVFALTLKVCFLHHQWNYLNVLSVIISLGGTLALFKGLSFISYHFKDLNDHDYHYAAEWLFLEYELFWFYAIFTAPLMCIFIDFISYQLHLNFFPSNEMIFLDSETEENRIKREQDASQDDTNVEDFPARESSLVHENDINLVELSPVGAGGERAVDSGLYVKV